MSSNASRVLSKMGMNSTKQHKHKFQKGIPKTFNQTIRKEIQDEQLASIYKQKRNVLFHKRDTTSYYNPLISTELRSYREQIKSCSSTDELYEIISTLPVSKSDWTILCDQVMKQFIKLNDHTQCLNVLQSMYQHNVPRSLATYNILFDGYITYGNTQSALDIYHKYLLKYENLNENPLLKPNIVTANTLLSGCKHKADINLAKQIWNDIIIEHNIKPNIATYINLIAVYGKAGLPDYCYALFTNMITKV